MATEMQDSAVIREFIAGVDLTASRNRAVSPSAAADDTVILPSGPTVPVIGILLNSPNVGQVAQVLMHGVAKIQASAAITRGARVAPTATGQAVTSAATNIPFGVALESATAVNQLINVFFQPNWAPM